MKIELNKGKGELIRRAWQVTDVLCGRLLTCEAISTPLSTPRSYAADLFSSFLLGHLLHCFPCPTVHSLALCWRRYCYSALASPASPAAWKYPIILRIPAFYTVGSGSRRRSDVVTAQEMCGRQFRCICDWRLTPGAKNWPFLTVFCKSKTHAVDKQTNLYLARNEAEV
jgi:hypothetical protein